MAGLLIQTARRTSTDTVFTQRPTQLVLKSILIRKMRSMQPVMITNRRTATILIRQAGFIECLPLSVLQHRNLREAKEIRLGLPMAFVSRQVVRTSENHLLLAMPTTLDALKSRLLVILVIISIITIRRHG